MHKSSKIKLVKSKLGANKAQKGEEAGDNSATSQYLFDYRISHDTTIIVAKSPKRSKVRLPAEGKHESSPRRAAGVMPPNGQGVQQQAQQPTYSNNAAPIRTAQMQRLQAQVTGSSSHSSSSSNLSATSGQGSSQRYTTHTAGSTPSPSSLVSPPFFSQSNLAAAIPPSTPVMQSPSSPSAFFFSSPQSPGSTAFASLGAGDPIASGSSAVSSPARKTASPRPSFGIDGRPPIPYPSALSRPSFSYSTAQSSSSSNVHLATLSRPTSPDSGSSSAYAYASANSQAFRNVHGSSASISSASLQPSTTNGSSASTTSSRASSRGRRPSLVTLQSYLEGVNHVTRVRSRSIRGHSRSASFEEASNQLFAKRDGAATPWHLDDVDEGPAWEENSAFLTPNSPTPRRLGLWSRNPSAVSLRRSALFTTEPEPQSHQTSPVPIRMQNYNDFAIDDDDDLGERTFVDRRDMALFPKHAHIDDEDEAKHLRNLEETGWSEHELNLLQEGDRLGIGLEHEDLPITNALEQSPDSPGIFEEDTVQFEIVRQLGYGSYAIVYLVKEVLFEENYEDEDHFPTDDAGSYTRTPNTTYGREFALKCLCKKNLSEEQVKVQRFEATLHRALPDHENVVALHKAFETSAWLFLVLEYCPGQDLYFWLEQARDSEGIDGDPSRAPSRLGSTRPPMPASIVSRALHHNGGSSVFDPPLGESPTLGHAFDEKEATPPSPSVLAANADTAILSRRRLRLISRMFVQMCDALQACHDAGVSHRDIKPENIIIVDNRAEMGSSGKIVIKITDWGLGTTDLRCEDFDCGSKPYMAYECRNNLQPSYEPKGADVWSLGIVLVNLLFHRCPWADPTLDDPDFSEFRLNPVEFLETRFEGMGNEVATYLATRVFCDVETSANCPSRVTAGEFGKWAGKLVRYMGEGSRRASISDSTVYLQQTTRRSPRPEGARLYQSPQHRSPRHSVQLNHADTFGSPARRKQRHSVELPSDLVEEIMANEGHIPNGHDQVDEAAKLDETLQDLELEDGEQSPEAGTTVRTRRRKRGARRKHKHGEGASSTAPVSPYLAPAAGDELEEVSLHLQALAREISQNTKNISPTASTSLSAARQSSDGLEMQPKLGKPRFADRLKGAFANGNPDLQAFADRAKQRDLMLNGGHPTSSAPAKLQHAHLNTTGSGVSSFGSVASSNSWSEEADKNAHWASTGNRRQRVSRTRNHEHASASLDRTGRPSRHQYHTSGQGASSASASLSSSPSRPTYSPPSSFSSATSFESRGVSRPPKPMLQSIDEAVYKPPPVRNNEQLQSSTSPLHSASTVGPGSFKREEAGYPFPSSSKMSPIVVEHKPVMQTHVIREPVLPPSAEPAAPTSATPRAKLGRLFNKFSRA